MPYRDLYRPTPEQSTPDTAEISLAKENERRFGHLDAGQLWPATIDQPFAAESMHSFAVSADGKRALVCSYKTAWLVDTQQMRSLSKTALPSYCRVAALNHDGSIAALVCDETLYRWGSGKPSLQRVWQSAGLEGSDILELSADGTIAVTSHYSQRATVRVFDFASKTLVHSFRADSDECLALHPNGRHIVCFGDNSNATIYGPAGRSRITNTTGGAFSPDGKILCTNDTNRDRSGSCALYSVVADYSSLKLGRRDYRKCNTDLSRWDFQARFAPDGRSVLLATNDGKICQLDVASQACKTYDLPMERKTSIIVDNHSLLTGPLSRRSLGIHTDGIAVVQLESENVLGLLCAASGEPQTLVGITGSGFYGSAETAEALSDKQEWPYERPALASQLLSEQQSLVSEDEALHFKELNARRNAWRPYKDKLVADLGDRELVHLNQGIIELTPELVHRALSAAAKEPCFGAPQLTQHTLRAVSEELKALSLIGKRAAFGDMLVRLRGPLQAPVAEKKAPVAEKKAPVSEKKKGWLKDDWLDE